MRFESIGYGFCHDEGFRISRPNGLDWYLLLIIRSRAYCEIDGRRIALKPGSLVVYDIGTPQLFGADSERYVNDWVAFIPGESEKYLLGELVFDKFIDGDCVEVCSELIKLMQHESRGSGEKREDMLSGLFRLILLKLATAFDMKKTKVPYFNELQGVRRKIHANPSVRYSVKQLAGQLHLSSSYFQHIYKSCFGISPTADMIYNRIEYAKQLLDSTSFSIKEVSELLEYGGDIEFIKQFKQITGVTPLVYKKRI